MVAFVESVEKKMMYDKVRACEMMGQQTRKKLFSFKRVLNSLTDL